MTSGIPARIWLLADGKPGHVSQSEGVLRALSERYPLQVDRLDVRLRGRIWRPLLRHVLNSVRPVSPVQALRLLRLAYSGVPTAGSGPDLVVSCGGETIFANALIGRDRSVRNVFLGTLRGLKPGNFDAVVSGLYLADVPNLVELTLSPGAFDRAAARQAGAELIAGLQPADDAPFWSVLIGGDGAGYRYTEADISALCRFLGAAHRRFSVRWLLTTSRRTGARIERQLQQYLTAHPRAFAHSVLFGESSRRVAASYIGAAERLFVTEESSSMLSEAMLCRCPVVSLSPVVRRPDAHYARFLEKHRSAGRLQSIELQHAEASLDQIKRTPCGDSTIAVADEIREGLACLLPQRLRGE
jgi:mitochondrial fission protein ELM1